MPIRVSDTSGNALWSSVASAITWAADHGAKVVNFSYSGISANSSTIPPPTMACGSTKSPTMPG